MPSRRRGFTLRELMVAILILGVAIGLTVPAIQRSRINSRRMQCASNLKYMGLGLNGYFNTKNHYPNAGTFHELPDTVSPASSTILGCFTDVTGIGFVPTVAPATNKGPDLGPLLNWVVDILPYIDSRDMTDGWDRKRNYSSTYPDPSMPGTSNARLANQSIGVLTCPEDTTVQPGKGNLSYVVNGGFSRWVGDPSIGWTGTASGGYSTRTGPDWGTDVAAQTGVMFLGTDTGTAAWDRRTTAASIVDGSSQTILASENLRAGASPGSAATGGLATNWACPHPNYVMFIASDKICPGGRCPTGQTSPTLTSGPRSDAWSVLASGPRGHGAVDGDAWAFANSPKGNSFESINGGVKSGVAEGASPFPSSGHAGGVNVLYCDGSVRFIQETIDGTVYAKLITPAGNRPSPYRQNPLNSDEF